jgi:predicted DNA-binding WGR domain protein
MKPRYFIHPKAGGRFWSVSIEGATVTTSYGKVDGKLTTASETFTGKNLGKANEVTPEQDAINRTDVQIEKKVREGYVEHAQHIVPKGSRKIPADWIYSNGLLYEQIGEVVKTEIDFGNLPENLCFYKPDNTVKNAGLQKKLDAGSCWYTRKRNGLAFVIAKGPDSKVQMYSRTMRKQHDKEADTNLTWNDRFPNIVRDAHHMMPNNSIILGELLVDERDDDDFKAIQEITKSVTPDALAHPKLAKVRFYVWDFAFWNGENLFQYKTAIRFQRIHKELQREDGELRYDTLYPIQWWTNLDLPTPDLAVQIAKDRGYEGFVVVDPDGVYGEKAFNFKGKPDRPRAYCAKLKPRFEDDFVVEFDPDNGVGEWSTKERYASGEARGIKNVVLFQYDSKGKKHYISELGVGLSELMKQTFADPKLFPQVWTVSYADRRYIAQGDDTNALDFSSYERARWTKKHGGADPDAKTPEECINPELDEE